MIIQTGNRTDIPAFYPEWFSNRISEGYVLVRNPYNPRSVTRYELNTEVVDLIVFCSKNPEPMLRYMKILEPYRQYWFVTITPYGKDIEPNVPPKDSVINSFIRLSGIIGPDKTVWRYDPIIINEDWTVKKHLETFEHMCMLLSGHTRICVISFIDLYQKVKKNYPEANAVSWDDQVYLTQEMVKIGRLYGMKIKPCGEDRALSRTGADCSGCMTVETFQEAIGCSLIVPANPANRKECACYITCDIGQYDTCAHLCRYCYANTDARAVHNNMKLHDPASPLLVGHLQEDDIITQAKQVSWIDNQLKFHW